MGTRTARTKQLTTMAVLCAISYIVVVVMRIPVVLFLKYEAKDVIITIGGFIFGPLAAAVISIVVSFLEMITISDTGIIGFAMNVISTCAFACTAAAVYKKRQSLSGALIGLLLGLALSTVAMILWNYLITPMYMGIPRQAVVELLVPAILPFNLIKGGLNTAITMLLYKPVVMGLRKAGLVEKAGSGRKTKLNLGFTLLAVVILATCVLSVLAFQGVI